MLGASIRLGEAIGSTARKTGERRVKPQVDAAVAGGLNRLEKKMLADVIGRVDRQQSEVEAIRRQVGNATRALDTAGDLANGLRADLHRQLSDDLDQRLSAVEEKLHLSLQAANRDTVNSMLASIEARVAPRISRLETEINDQAAVVAELRECSLQSERSILRLLTVIERSVNPKLSVVSGRGQEEPGSGSSGTRRPASFR